LGLAPPRPGVKAGVAGLDRRVFWQQHVNAEAVGQNGAGQDMGETPGPGIFA